MNNYFKIINRFWDEATDLEGYKADHAALFFALVDSINRNGWRDTEIEYDRIINKVRLGKKNYLDCRRWLLANGFITLKEGKGDYAKARFGLGDAVSGRTASDTAQGEDLPADTVPSAVSYNTASGTASDTGPDVDAVLSGTASGTAGSTASGTASDTHLLEELITSNNLLSTHQQQLADASDEGGGDGSGDDRDSADDQKKREGPSPNPLPVSIEEVRQVLLASTVHQRYATEQLKLTTSDTGYAELVELFILQQQAQAADPEQPFTDSRQVRRHFMNWLGKRAEFKPTQASSTHATQTTRTARSLRPTALGQPDYRGEGSTCNVDL